MFDGALSNSYGFTAEEVGVCTFCGEVPEIDLLCGEIDGHSNHFDLCGCCTQSQEARNAGWSWEEVYGVSLAESAALISGKPVSKTVEEGAEVIWATKLRCEWVKSRNLVKDFIRQHHRHNPRPNAGDKARFVVWNGDTIVGVAMLGNPVARKYMQANPGTLEVNRVCVAGPAALRRNACTMLYAACCKWAKKNGFDAVITYTLESELGTTLKAAGWVVDMEGAGGGSWNVPSRPREQYNGPTCMKVRWKRELRKKKKA